MPRGPLDSLSTNRGASLPRQGVPCKRGTIAATRRTRAGGGARVHCLVVCGGAGVNTAPAGAGDGVTSVARLRDSGGAGEPAGLTKMSGSMRRFVQVVKHYPGQQQVNLSVEIEVPGSWFGGTEMGSLNASERRQKYKVQAVEYAEVREFPGASLRACKVKGFGRRLRVCESMCLHTTCRAELWPAWTWALGALGQLASELLQSGRHGAWGRERVAFEVCRNACAGHAWGECV